MFANKFTLAVWPVLFGLLAANPLPAAASSASSTVALYAYGADAQGLNIFYRNGLAYMGSAASVADAVAINFTQSTTTDTAYVVTPADSSTAFNQTLYLSINTTGDGDQQVSFSAANSSMIQSGFKIFGQELFYVDNDTMVTDWYAAAVDNETDVYALMWNAARDSDDGSFAVALRTTAPVGT